jgi:amidophosphoribosyltransferase
MFPCIFDLSTKNKDLATYKAVASLENKNIDINDYLNPENPSYSSMVEGIRKNIGFTSLKFQSLENLIKAVIEAPGNNKLKREDLCLSCWTGKF